MAQEITYEDKVQGRDLPLVPITEKFTFEDANEIKDVVNFNALNVDEEAVRSPLTEASISGTYELDLTATAMWLLTLTADTTITISALANSTSFAYTVKLTGDFVPTLTGVNVYGDAYDGTIENLLSFNSYRTAAGVQVNDVIITNLA